jgi:hypothetical protein
MSATLLDTQLHQIRNIQIVRKDLLPLVAENDEDKKLFGSSINAYGAHIQAKAGNADFCIFSSLLTVLTDEKDTSCGNIGTFEEHVFAAVRPVNYQKTTDFMLRLQCPSGMKEELLARPRWAIPLCSGKLQVLLIGS